MAKTQSAAGATRSGPDLTAIVRILGSTLVHAGVDSMCRSCTRAIVKELPDNCRASLWLVDPAHTQVSPMATSVRKASRIKTLPAENLKATARLAALAQICRSGKAFQSTDTRRKPAVIGLAGLPCGSELCIPIKDDQGVEILLEVACAEKGKFTKTHLETLQILAQHIGKALRNAHIHEHLKDINERLMQLQSLGSEISASLDLCDILDATIRRLPRIMGLRLCSVFLFNPVTNSLELKAHNHPDLSDKKISIKNSENRIINQIIGLSRSRWIRDVEMEFHRRNRRKYASKSSLNLILKAGEKLIGVLNLNDKADGSSFTEEDFNLTDMFANQLALSVNNSHLYHHTLQMALFDGLTGLYVHRHFQETLVREIARSARTRSTFSLMLADIDHFKNINDRFGHQSGDTVLRALSGIFLRLVRQIDYVCRYGGEEFAFILPDTPLGRAKVLASRIQNAVNRTRFRLGGKSCRISLSFGLAENNGSLDKEELIRRADQALFAAKKQGRNRTIQWEAGMDKQR